ncbi:bifunctional hydroxymethylpyrimidine kinase/phosphomethylpyrimidine kinase [Thalassobacillus sp. CUG 92003]|uniref:bifunctional hydroxymethylpyrimidine kinase/phosphomethylpyrimidine kinase n=1 Tax=Thalassobacillus sp. CUG 92003 TaxID=2736641 RepID=UPI0015E66003|nr:bifunctional hydroxymethylpyrimidine kinase/phosphomethylpyrimidine kinase [Thalassobacillus sp. CUG 92003]
MKETPCALTIAGTDPSGGAGIQADLKTFQELKSYGMSVITSVVAQNTTGVQDVFHLPLEMLKRQITSIIEDMPLHAMKTGMIANRDMMKVIAPVVQNKSVAYVMDPVMVAKSGDPLMEEADRLFLRDELLPYADVVTPNLPEAEAWTGKQIRDEKDMKEAAVQLVQQYGAGAALIKGGHLDGQAIDILYDGHHFRTFASERINTKHTHGTGCTYSAAITAYLSQGYVLEDAVEAAKQYVTSAIRHSFALGHGNGPTNHWAWREEVKSR